MYFARRTLVDFLVHLRTAGMLSDSSVPADCKPKLVTETGLIVECLAVYLVLLLLKHLY